MGNEPFTISLCLCVSFYENQGEPLHTRWIHPHKVVGNIAGLPQAWA